MKGGKPQQRDPVPDPANLSQQELSSNQEVTAIPWFCGQQICSLIWITPIYNQFTKDIDTGGKGK